MDDPHDLVVRTIRTHAGALLRTARAHSLCPDDAHDAYQRGLEIFLRRASTIEPDTADRWLHVVIKHEAQAIRRSRGREMATEDAQLDARGAGAPDDDERVLRFDRLARSAEALARLKPQEVRALWLKAQGHSYAEIAASEGWTYTKVNRCLTEGRRSFLDRYAAIERGEECRRWEPVISAMVDGEATAEQLAAARPHLRRCAGCRATLRDLQAAGPRLAGVLPVLPAAALSVEALGGAPVEPAGAFGAEVVGAAASGRSGGGVLDAVTRGAEAAAVAVHDRVTAWAVKLQLTAEAVAGGKVAAVAASAVAVAGGGAVTVAEVREARRTPPTERRAEVPAGGANRSAAMTVARLPFTAPAAVPVDPIARVRARAGTSAPAAGQRRDLGGQRARAASARSGAPGSGEFSAEGGALRRAGEFGREATRATASASSAAARGVAASPESPAPSAQDPSAPPPSEPRPAPAAPVASPEDPAPTSASQPASAIVEGSSRVGTRPSGGGGGGEFGVEG